jgi:hypothetical protein
LLGIPATLADELSKNRKVGFAESYPSSRTKKNKIKGSNSDARL